jgi:hypothetical protein
MREEPQHNLRDVPGGVVPPGFDYGSVPEHADELRATAKRIREWMSTSVIEIGAASSRCGIDLEHGQFLRWVDAEFALCQRTAENMMAAAKWADGKNEIVADLAPTAIYALAAKSTPPAVQVEVLARLESGEILPPHAVLKMIRAARARIAPEGGPQNNQLPIETPPGRPQAVRPESAEPIPGEPDSAPVGAVQLEAEQRDAAPLFTAPPERQEQTGFVGSKSPPADRALGDRGRETRGDTRGRGHKGFADVLRFAASRRPTFEAPG